MQMYGVTSGPAAQSRPHRLPLALTDLHPANLGSVPAGTLVSLGGIGNGIWPNLLTCTQKGSVYIQAFVNEGMHDILKGRIIYVYSSS